MLVSILACVWFLSVLVASGPYLTQSILIVTCIYLLLRCQLSDMQQLIQCGDYAFSISLQDAYLHTAIVKHHVHFLWFVWHNIPYELKVLPFWLATALGFSQPLLTPLCPFAIARVSVLLFIWMIFWSWFALSRQVRGLTHFSVPYWFSLDYILIFPSLTSTSHRPFVSLSYLGILSACQYLYLLIS